MSHNMKLQLHFMDRIGIVADIADVMTRMHMNIISMEVKKREKTVDIFIEFVTSGQPTDEREVYTTLRNIPDLVDARPIKAMPQERRESRFQVVLDNISDGILSIDEVGRVTTFNWVVQKILGCDQDEIVGRNIETLSLPDCSLLECLSRKTVKNVKKSIITETGRYQFIATDRPIEDATGHVVGAVEIMKNMTEIQQLAHAIARPAKITFSDFIGHSPLVTNAISFAQKIAPTDAIVLIQGESGTGKEVFARAIHSASGRDGPFTPVNCAALPETLLESELFGYVGGAFTGARRQGKAGLFETAQGGTIFLDEIGEMPLGPQAKILRLIQEKSVRRVGGTTEIPIDTRIICATNKNLAQQVTAKQFREDLFYRINLLPIHIAPLRERSEDIPLLVEYFLFQFYSSLGRTVKSIDALALEKLRSHHWPGNARELKNVIERAAILENSERIGSQSILFSHEIGKSLAHAEQQKHQPLIGESLAQQIAYIEKQIITEKLRRAKSIRNAAKALGISHTTLINKIKKHQVRVERN